MNLKNMPRDSSYFHLSTWTIIRFFAIAIGLVTVYFIRDILFSLVFAVIVGLAFIKRYFPQTLTKVLV